MKNSKIRTIAYRRKRKGKTNYKNRLKILLSSKPRLVVRKSLTEVTAQIITYDEKGDKVLLTVRGRDLKKFGWNYNFKNVPSAYLVGLLVAKRAKENKITEAVLDIGLNKSIPGSKLYAVLKGAVDNGLIVPHSDSVLPSDDRIQGKHIENYSVKLKENDEEYKKQFSGYLKNKVEPGQIVKMFNDIKNKLTGA